jgi:mono/diheme cytochrome c family protein
MATPSLSPAGEAPLSLLPGVGPRVAEKLAARGLLARGRQRYEIYCLPCHSPVGDGDGPVVRRGFPHPPSYHAPRLRDAPDRHFFDVITNGYGIMHPYADRVAPPDRWAIVAYIRALQLSQHAQASQLPDALRARLPGTQDANGGQR